MWSAPKEKTRPGPDAGLPRTGASVRLFSTSSPDTTATAPEDTSWSCQPVSFSGVQHSSHRSTWVSRWSEAKTRSSPSKATRCDHSSGCWAIGRRQLLELDLGQVAVGEVGDGALSRVGRQVGGLLRGDAGLPGSTSDPVATGSRTISSPLPIAAHLLSTCRREQPRPGW